jgi:hypothetical protein
MNMGMTHGALWCFRERIALHAQGHAETNLDGPNQCILKRDVRSCSLHTRMDLNPRLAATPNAPLAEQPSMRAPAVLSKHAVPAKAPARDKATWLSQPVSCHLEVSDSSAFELDTFLRRNDRKVY